MMKIVVAAGIAFSALLLALTGIGPVTGQENAAARFEGKDTLLRPQNYREWIFVGSSLGLQYAKNADAALRQPELYHNVYINLSSYREFSRTGKFPEGTVMVLELASSEVKKEPGLQGSFQKEFTALEASVKDSKRFTNGWAYYSFDGGNGQIKDKAKPFADSECWSCHHQKAATDNVFTQYYPVLRAVASKLPSEPSK
jgi:hypothetical protein